MHSPQTVREGAPVQLRLYENSNDNFKPPADSDASVQRPSTLNLTTTVHRRSTKRRARIASGRQSDDGIVVERHMVKSASTRTMGDNMLNPSAVARRLALSPEVEKALIARRFVPSPTLAAARRHVETACLEQPTTGKLWLGRLVKMITGQPLSQDEDWEIERGEVIMGPKIGVGTFGTVYRGDWHGSVNSDNVVFARACSLSPALRMFSFAPYFTTFCS